MKSPTLSEIYEYEAVLFGSSFDFVLLFPFTIMYEHLSQRISKKTLIITI